MCILGLSHWQEKVTLSNWVIWEYDRVGHREATKDGAYPIACVVGAISTPGPEGQGKGVVTESEDILQELLPS